jgi:hypothetical protein
MSSKRVQVCARHVLDICEMANAVQSTVLRFLDIEAVRDSGNEESTDYESVASSSVVFSAE